MTLGGVSIAEHLISLLNPFGLLLGLNGVILLAYIIAIPDNEIVIPTILMRTVLLAGAGGDRDLTLVIGGSSAGARDLTRAAVERAGGEVRRPNRSTGCRRSPPNVRNSNVMPMRRRCAAS